MLGPGWGVESSHVRPWQWEQVLQWRQHGSSGQSGVTVVVVQ